MFAALTLVLTTLVPAATTKQSAHADTAVTTIAWPGVPLPYGMIYAHGDGSVTVASDDCGNQYNDSMTSVATITPDYSQSYPFTKNTNGWRVLTCYYGRAVDTDQTVYLVQDHTTTPYVERLIAERDGAIRGLLLPSKDASKLRAN